MRVIAGEARGVPLITPKGTKTRPTSDRTKESLFNILGVAVKGSMFLDLFSGCGGVGIEAISRGALLCVFVDNSKAAIAAINANLSKTKLGDRAEVLETSVAIAINKLTTSSRNFDIIFLDPPYDGGYVKETLDILAKSDILSSGGSIIVETNSQLHNNTLGEAFELTDERQYGQTRFLFLQYKNRQTNCDGV